MLIMTVNVIECVDEDDDDVVVDDDDVAVVVVVVVDGGGGGGGVGDEEEKDEELVDDDDDACVPGSVMALQVLWLEVQMVQAMSFLMCLSSPLLCADPLCA